MTKQKNLLLIDDNDRYAKLISDDFSAKNYAIDRGVNAKEGLSKFKFHSIDHYELLITDVTMETKSAGLFMAWKIHRLGFRGKIIVASTGFDTFGITTLARLTLSYFGVHYIVPKTTIIEKKPLYYPTNYKAKQTYNFDEI